MCSEPMDFLNIAGPRFQGTAYTSGSGCKGEEDANREGAFVPPPGARGAVGSLLGLR